MPVVFPHIGSRGERHIDDWVSSAKDEVCPEELVDHKVSAGEEEASCSQGRGSRPGMV